VLTCDAEVFVDSEVFEDIELFEDVNITTKLRKIVITRIIIILI
jgi:hypothetical protein